MSEIRDDTVTYRPGDPKDLLRHLRPIICEKHWVDISVQAGQPIQVRWLGEPNEELVAPVEFDVSAALRSDRLVRHDVAPLPSRDAQERVLAAVADLFRAFVIVTAKRLHPGFLLVSEQHPWEILDWYGLPPALPLESLFGARLLPCAEVSAHSLVLLGVPYPESDAASARMAVRITRVLP